MAPGRRIPHLGDNKITRFFDEYRDDDWYQTSINVKGDLGFAELSITGSYFDRKINYEWDNTNYNQWRTLNNTGVYAAYYRLYDTGTLHGTTFNWQKQNRWAYEARLTSQGDSRLQWMAGAFYEDVYDWWEYGAKTPGLETTVAWDEANIRACDLAGQGENVACPLPLTDYYYYNRYSNKVKQLAFFGEASWALTDKWSVTGGARWFEYQAQLVRPVQRATRTAGRERSLRQRTDQQGQRQRHHLQARDRVPRHARRHALRALQRGLPPRRR